MDFGQLQDAMWTNEPFLYHSLLSAPLNCQLLQPQEVIDAALQAYALGKAPLNSVEGFVRQILGWREFMRGIYQHRASELIYANHFGHQRPLPDWFWTGKTEMTCLSQVIGQTLATGYAHHIQRLMVLGLYATLAELQPQAVSDWFHAIYIDPPTGYKDPMSLVWHFMLTAASSPASLIWPVALISTKCRTTANTAASNLRKKVALTPVP